MSDTRESDQGDGAGAASAGRRPPGVPLWVKAFVAVGIVLLVLLVVMLLGGGGGHGPGRHTSSGQSPGPADPAAVPRSGATR